MTEPTEETIRLSFHGNPTMSNHLTHQLTPQKKALPSDQTKKQYHPRRSLNSTTTSKTEASKRTRTQRLLSIKSTGALMKGSREGRIRMNSILETATKRCSPSSSFDARTRPRPSGPRSALSTATPPAVSQARSSNAPHRSQTSGAPTFSRDSLSPPSSTNENNTTSI